MSTISLLVPMEALTAVAQSLAFAHRPGFPNQFTAPGIKDTLFETD
jgi:hypothetical protein